MPSTVIDVSVCLSVREHLKTRRPNVNNGEYFLSVLPVARSSSGDVSICSPTVDFVNDDIVCS